MIAFERYRAFNEAAGADFAAPIVNHDGNGRVGFLSCLAMVLVAKALGYVLKKPEDYYPQDDDDA